MHSRSLAIAACAMLAGAAATARAADPLILLAAAAGSVTQAPPGQPDQRVVPGQTIAIGSRLTSGADGPAQLLLSDGTRLALGPGTTLTIDRHDPDARSADGPILSLTLAEGLLRLTRGRTPARAAIRVTSPAASIDSGGGIALVAVEPDSGITTVTRLAAEPITVTARGSGEQRTLRRDGFSLRVVPALPIEIAAAPARSIATDIARLQASSATSMAVPDSAAGIPSMRDAMPPAGLDARGRLSAPQPPPGIDQIVARAAGDLAAAAARTGLGTALQSAFGGGTTSGTPLTSTANGTGGATSATGTPVTLGATGVTITARSSIVTATSSGSVFTFQRTGLSTLPGGLIGVTPILTPVRRSTGGP